MCRRVRNRTGVRRAALGADPVLGPAPPLPAPAPAQPLPHGALRAPLPTSTAPPQLPHPTTRRIPSEGEATVCYIAECRVALAPCLCCSNAHADVMCASARCLIRCPSGGRGAGTRFGRPTYPTRTLLLRSQTSGGWSSMAIRSTSLVGAPTSTLALTSILCTSRRFENIPDVNLLHMVDIVG